MNEKLLPSGGAAAAADEDDDEDALCSTSIQARAIIFSFLQNFNFYCTSFHSVMSPMNRE